MGNQMQLNVVYVNPYWQVIKDANTGETISNVVAVIHPDTLQHNLFIGEMQIPQNEVWRIAQVIMEVDNPTLDEKGMPIENDPSLEMVVADKIKVFYHAEDDDNYNIGLKVGQSIESLRKEDAIALAKTLLDFAEGVDEFDFVDETFDPENVK